MAGAWYPVVQAEDHHPASTPPVQPTRLDTPNRDRSVVTLRVADNEVSGPMTRLIAAAERSRSRYPLVAIGSCFPYVEPP